MQHLAASGRRRNSALAREPIKVAMALKWNSLQPHGYRGRPRRQMRERELVHPFDEPVSIVFWELFNDRHGRCERGALVTPNITRSLIMLETSARSASRPAR